MVEMLLGTAIALVAAWSFYLRATSDLKAATESLRAESKKGFRNNLEALQMTIKALQSADTFGWKAHWDDDGNVVFEQIVKPPPGVVKIKSEREERGEHS